MSDHRCLNCARPEKEFPLVVLQFVSKQVHICPQCLPLLIHHPEKLEQKLKEAESRGG